MANYQQPLELRVSLPSEREQRTGIYATTHKDSRIMFFRINQFDFEIVQEAQKLLDVKMSHLMRHVVVSYCKSLLKHRDDWLKEHGHAVKKPNST